MSVASCSIPCIKISSSSCSSSTPTTCSSSSSSSSSFRFSATKPSVTIRSSNAEGPFRRPVAPSLRPPSPPLKPSPPSPPPPPSPSPAPSSAPSKPVSVAGVPQASDPNVITMEFQRQMAKELQEYFRQKKLEEANQGPFFGFISKNEIANGRWAMFGFAVGLLTEYATGSDFVDQVKILLSNFGIVDLE